jgi:signal recognition particle subunit SRP19
MPDHFYVYPAYLQKGLSRAQGRRVPAEEALTDLSAEELVEASKKLGAKAVVEGDRHYPRRFFDYAGRVKVTKASGKSKATFLRALAAEVRRARATALKR